MTSKGKNKSLTKYIENFKKQQMSQRVATICHMGKKLIRAIPKMYDIYDD